MSKEQSVLLSLSASTSSSPTDSILDLCGSGLFSDAKLVFDKGETMDSHRFVLAAFSPLLNKILLDEEQNGNINFVTIHLPDLKKSVFEEFIQNVYLGRDQEIEETYENLIEFLGIQFVKDFDSDLIKAEENNPMGTDTVYDKGEESEQDYYVGLNLDRGDVQVDNSTSNEEAMLFGENDPPPLDFVTPSYHQQHRYNRVRIKDYPKTKKSEAWNYFTDINHDFARCDMCGKIIKTLNASTSGLRQHLKSHGLLKNNQYIRQDMIMPREVIMPEKRFRAPTQICSSEYSNQFPNLPRLDLSHHGTFQITQNPHSTNSIPAEASEEEEDQVEFKIKGPDENIWSFYTYLSGGFAACNECEEKFETRQGFPENLWSHLQYHRQGYRPNAGTRTFMRQNISLAWKHYTKINKEYASCNECSKLIKTPNASTSGLRQHIKSHGH